MLESHVIWVPTFSGMPLLFLAHLRVFQKQPESDRPGNILRHRTAAETLAGVHVLALVT